MIYYAIWSRQLKKALQDATNAVKEHRDRTRNLVANYLADSVALELLRRAELTDGNGGPGAYYHRIDKLINCFDGVETTAKREQQLANQRLMPQGSTKQNVQQTKKPNLEIRTEILDVPKLVANTQRLRGSLEDKSGELLEFAEILLRMMGTESPAQIEMHVRESAARSGRLAAHEDHGRRKKDPSSV